MIRDPQLQAPIHAEDIMDVLEDALQDIEYILEDVLVIKHRAKRAEEKLLDLYNMLEG